jgi:hypothetical protein
MEFEIQTKIYLIINRAMEVSRRKEEDLQILFGVRLSNEKIRQSALIPAVLRIRDVYPRSRIRIFSIPDPHQRI